MLDNLREDAGLESGYDDEISDFLDDLDGEEENETKTDATAFLTPVKKMSAVQRFIIAALLFMLVCLVGSMALLVTGKFAI